MTDINFTPHARRQWDSMDQITRKRILKTTRCEVCGAVGLKAGSARIRDGRLRLAGRCSVCGGAIKRAIETEEWNPMARVARLMAELLADGRRAKTRIHPEHKLLIVLTPSERDLVVDQLLVEPEVCERLRGPIPKNQEVALSMTYAEMDELFDCLAATANHARSAKLRSSLDRLYDRLADVLDSYEIEEP